MLAVSREWTQHFEWFVHVPLGRKAGISEEHDCRASRRAAALRHERRREVAYDFCEELLRNKGVSETTYRRAVVSFGETA